MLLFFVEGHHHELNRNQFLTWSHEVFGTVALVLLPLPSLTGDYIIMASEAMTVEAPAQALEVQMLYRLVSHPEKFITRVEKALKLSYGF